MSGRTLPWILGGGALAVGAYLWPRRSDGHNEGARVAHDEPLVGDWVWPLGAWAGRAPEISDGFHGTRRDATGHAIQHGGVDLMYRRRPGDLWQPGSKNGSKGWVMPDARPALAASAGVIWFAAYTPRGWSVIVDHAPRKLATYYTHLSSLHVSSKQTVRAGQPIGVVGADPLDAAHLMHLHFELWRGAATTRFDPEPFMRSWRYLPDPGDAKTSS